MSEYKDIIQQLKEEEERNEAEIKAYMESNKLAFT